MTHAPTGTIGYIPPEAMRRSSGVEVTSAVYKKWDSYSFAVLMCYTLSGTDPFFGLSDAQVITMILFDNKRPSIPTHVDAEPGNPVFKGMIQRLWHDDPLERDDFEVIVEQLRKFVTEPNVKQTGELVVEKSISRGFVRTLPPLHAGTKRMCVCISGVGVDFSCVCL